MACNIPVDMMNDLATVTICGEKDGRTAAIGASVIICIAFGYFYYKQTSVDELLKKMELTREEYCSKTKNTAFVNLIKERLKNMLTAEDYGAFNTVICDYPSLQTAGIVAGVLLALSWGVLPGIMKQMKIDKFNQNELMINNLTQGGMNKTDARIQLLQQRQSTAANEAILQAAREQAQATREQTNALSRALNSKR